MLKQQAQLAWYGTTIFLSSAALLVLEIVAGRLIAPYVGVSLYTWTSVIGVILAGLSLGNWLGGVWADRQGGERALGIALGFAGFASLATLPLLTVIAPLIQQSGVDLLSASFFYVCGLFFLPAALLGIVTPLATTLALQLGQRPGRVIGQMHALAALGSILGAFITGFLLVQYLGSRMIVTATGLLLLLLALPYFSGARRRAGTIGLAVAAGLAVATDVQRGFESPCDRESSYFCIRVVDDNQGGTETTIRTLVLDHLVHGSNHAEHPQLLLTSYVHLADELIAEHFGASRTDRLRYFFVGGGAYSQPRAIRAAHPLAAVTVAELDPEVTAVATAQLFVPTADLHIVHQDARVALRLEPPRSFDVVVADAFHDVSVPYHLLTREFAHLVKSRLSTDGLFVVDVIDLFPSPHLVKSLYKTLAEEFTYVDVWIEQVAEQPARMTFILSASDLRQAPDQIIARQGLKRRWYRVTEPLLQTSPPLDELPLLTDDFVPVERLLSPLLLGPTGL